MGVKYNFNDKNEFVIEGYDKAKTFASFLPGIAGVEGIPMWSNCNFSFLNLLLIKNTAL